MRGERVGAPPDRAEERPLGTAAQARAVKIAGWIFFEVMVARNRVSRAALLAQAHPNCTICTNRNTNAVASTG